MLRKNAMSLQPLTLVLAAAGLTLSSVAHAQTVRVKCEIRDDRSKVSVDGRDLSPRNGDFMALVASGDNFAMSGIQTAIGDEVEFDFDSEADDVAEGATEIAPDFIEGNQVTARLLRAPSGPTVISARVRCRDRR